MLIRHGGGFTAGRIKLHFSVDGLCKSFVRMFPLRNERTIAGCPLRVWTVSDCPYDVVQAEPKLSMLEQILLSNAEPTTKAVSKEKAVSTEPKEKAASITKPKANELAKKKQRI